jgi:hypothetical protein
VLCHSPYTQRQLYWSTRCSKCHLSPDPQYFVIPFAVKNIKIEIYKLRFACCFIRVWHLVSYKLREEHGPNVRVGLKRKELTEDWMKLWWATLWFVILTRYSLSYQIKEDEVSGMCSMCGREGTYILHDFGGGQSEGKTLLWWLGIGGRLDWIFKVWHERVWTRLMWLRVGTNGVLLWM